MLEIRGLSKKYEDRPLLQNISFEIGVGETICLLGPSGSGKSTLLRLIAGLEYPEAGQILWDGKDLAATPAHLRDFGLVFQDYALFPHLNVFDNVAFGLQMRNWKGKEIKARLAEVLDLVNLRGFENRKVTDLSGGEQQRVALARALAPRPRLLMFDEPLGALDRALREDLLDELRRILHRTRIPALYVTHDQEEAFTIADRVLLLHDGHIVQAGTPAEIWSRPNSVWTAQFLGLGTVIEGEVTGRKGKVQTASGVFDVRCGHKHKAGDKVRLLVRPLAGNLERSQGTTRSANHIRGRVKDVIFQQDSFKVILDNDLYFFLKDEPKIGKLVAIKARAECLE